ncbi:epimerase [uncultured Cedecea sp.]|uniref:epimerase n=1 Tax=uncultured Cedecea sp. TaxID=988762 RepID=UPI002628C859|nr:epimerase [uncultured Cedecea sp.]
MLLHPSLASANPLYYGRELAALEKETIGSIHLDIEDTSFISNITFGMKTVRAIARQTAQPLSFHLMVSQPLIWLPWLEEVKPAWIFVHAEALENPSEVLAAIRLIGAKAGLAFNPSTDVMSYRYLAAHLEALMIMTSEPDGHQQQFIPQMCEKIIQVRQYFPDTECWVDGGITLTVSTSLAQAGAQHLVIGRALFTSTDYHSTLSQFTAISTEFDPNE